MRGQQNIIISVTKVTEVPTVAPTHQNACRSADAFRRSHRDAPGYDRHIYKLGRQHISP